MKPREALAWFLVVALAVTFGIQAYTLETQTRRAKEADQECGKVVYDCATELHACQAECIGTCYKEGWTPPSDFPLEEQP